MQWFYAVGQETRGPVSPEEMQTLLSQGAVSATTKVWNEKMRDWQPLQMTGLGAFLSPGKDGRPAADGRLTCIITGKLFPPSELIQTPHGWVSTEGKARYYGALRENAPLPLARSEHNAQAHKKYVIVPAVGGKLPKRCVKTNEAVGEEDMKPTVMYATSPLIFLTLLLSLLVFVIVYLVTRKKIVLDVPISPAGRDEVRRQTIIGWTIVAGSIALLIGAFAIDVGYIGFPAVVALLVGLVYTSIKSRPLRVVKSKDGDVWLAGASPAFLNSLPPYPG